MHVARRSIVVMSAGLALVGGLSACGRVDVKDKPSAARPPVEMLVSAAITDRGVHLSPAEIGGGPVRIVVNNQSERTIKASLVRDDGGTTATQYKIDPGQNAAIRTELKRGSYRLIAGKNEEQGAALAVGARRPSSDGELLLP
jgi:hypothetical protein